MLILLRMTVHHGGHTALVIDVQCLMRQHMCCLLTTFMFAPWSHRGRYLFVEKFTIVVFSQMFVFLNQKALTFVPGIQSTKKSSIGSGNGSESNRRQTINRNTRPRFVSREVFLINSFIIHLDQHKNRQVCFIFLYQIQMIFLFFRDRLLIQKNTISD